ncbi:YbaB/EbfC family nucleoid-associated protein [Streptosporangium sp. NBC_01639]|uniref:YbaB/EbfC family nucleoid-associated protein n=1 Tax=Streptosporangium sp. NBC_01639 TaxID=2975948 RepID=UPI003862F6A2|nr:YbaB/EbfC family nucleoid-associated protein [Streptosporangium sp. NBC_01639]
MDSGYVPDEDLEQTARQADAMVAWLEGAQAGMDEIVGVGEGASGQVRAEVAADGKVLDVTFGPRSLRLDSATLAEEVLSAVQQAQRDAGRKADDLMREALDGFDPAEARATLDRISQSRW